MMDDDDAMMDNNVRGVAMHISDTCTLYSLRSTLYGGFLSYFFTHGNSFLPEFRSFGLRLLSAKAGS